MGKQGRTGSDDGQSLPYGDFHWEDWICSDHIFEIMVFDVEKSLEDLNKKCPKASFWKFFYADFSSKFFLTVKVWALGLNGVKRSFGASITVIMTLRSDKSQLSVAKIAILKVAAF